RDRLDMVAHQFRSALDIPANDRVHDVPVIAGRSCHVRAGWQRQTPVTIETIVNLGPEIQQGGRAAFGDQRKMKFAMTVLPGVRYRFVVARLLRKLREHAVDSADLTYPSFAPPDHGKSKCRYLKLFAERRDVHKVSARRGSNPEAALALRNNETGTG